MLKQTPKQLKTLLILRESSIFSDAISKSSVSIYILKKLLKKKLCNMLVVTNKIADWRSSISNNNSNIKLDVNNILLLKSITQCKNKFKVFVLTIDTELSKEQTYFFLLLKFLKKGLKILFLVPSIDAATVIFNLFKKKLSVPINIYHSEISETKKIILWEKCKTQETAIIISTYIGIFLPINKLGIIIIEEENNLLYKVTKQWTLNIKNLAIMRAYKENIPIVLEGNELSLETLYNIKRKKFKLIKIVSLNKQGCFKEINQKLIYTNNERCKGIFSISLIKKVKKHLYNAEKVCFIIDHIYDSFTLLKCNSCNKILKCNICSEYYEFNFHYRELFCRYCLQKQELPVICIKCNMSQYTFIKFNIDFLKKSIDNIFYGTKIIFINKTTINHLKNSLNKFYLFDKSSYILIGKKKWIEKCNVNYIKCIVFLYIDFYFRTNNFRSIEYLGQLYFSIIRKISKCFTRYIEVLIQTRTSKHFLLEQLIKVDYKKFSLILLEMRKNNKLPPFCYHVIVKVESKDNKLLAVFFKKYYNYLTKNYLNYSNDLWVAKSDIIFFKKYYNSFLVQILLAHNSRLFLNNVLNQSIKFINKFYIKKNIDLTFDMDPV